MNKKVDIRGAVSPPAGAIPLEEIVTRLCETKDAQQKMVAILETIRDDIKEMTSNIIEVKDAIKEGSFKADEVITRFEDTSKEVIGKIDEDITSRGAN